MDDPILIKAKEALSAATAAGDTTKASAIKQKTIEYLQRRKTSAPQSTQIDTPPPKDTSFGGAIQNAFDQPTEGIGNTLDLLGAHDAGKFLKDLVPTDPNYDPASAHIAKPSDEHAWYDPRHYDYSQLPRAAVEQAGQFAGSLATRAAGATAGGLVAGPAGAIAGGVAGPAAFEGIQVLGSVAQQLAKSNGREKPSASDWAQAAATATASGLLNSVIPESKIARPLTEGLTEGLQSAVEQVGSTAGTPGGVQVDPSQTVSEALVGAGSTVPGQVAHSVVSAPVNVAKAVAKKVNDPRGFKAQAKNDEAAFASDVRVAREINEAKKDIRLDPGDNPDVAAANSLWDRYKEQFQKVADSLYDNQKISKDDYDKLVNTDANIKKLAGQHNKRLGYQDIDYLASMPGIDQETRQTLIDAAMDMDSLSRQGRVNRSIGPGEIAARSVGPFVRMGTGASIGHAVAGTGGAAIGAMAGLAAGQVLPAAGRAFDRFMGAGKPTLMQGAQARERLAKKRGIDTQSSFARMKQIEADNYSNPADVVSLPKNYFDQRQKANYYKAKADEAAKARQLQKEHEALVAKTQKLIDDWDKAQNTPEPDLHDQKLTDRAQKATFQFQLNQAKETLKTQQKAADEAKAHADRLDAEAEKSKADAQAWQDMMAGKNGPALGGWKRAIMDSGKNDFGIDLTWGDLSKAVERAVNEGIISKDDALAAWHVRGARINKTKDGGRPYYAIHDFALENAVRRSGSDFSLDALDKMKDEQGKKNSLERGRDRAKVREQLDAERANREEDAAKVLPFLQSYLVAKTAKPEQLQEAVSAVEQKLASTKAKAAATKAQTPKKTKEAPVTTPKSTVRNPQAYQATIDHATSVRDNASQSVPDVLRPVLEAVRAAKTKPTKAKLVENALKAHPEYEAYIKAYIAPLSLIGGTRGKTKALPKNS